MTLLSPRREVGEFRKRYKWMALFAVVVFGVLLGRVFQLQVLQYDALATTARVDPSTTETLPRLVPGS